MSPTSGAGGNGAIFLHTGWRSGGTSIWAKLRAQPGVMGFYEPLHEVLASIDQPLIDSLTAGSWDSRHGATSPYFLEYAPLLSPTRSGGRYGVAGYEARFAYERFFLDAGEADEPLQRYIEGLLAAAASYGRVPVLKFCRSLGRVGWMQRRFPGALHALVLRDPLSQYHSATAQLAHGNRFFLVAPIVAMARNRDMPIVQVAAQAMGVRLPALPAGRRDLDFELCWRHRQTLDEAARFRAFLAFWTITLEPAASEPAVFVIEANRLPLDSYRAAVEAKLSQHVGAPVQLDVVPTAPHVPPPPGAGWSFRAASQVRAGNVLLEKYLCAPPLLDGANPDESGVGPAGWRDADAPGAWPRIGQALYFAAMRASMPVRRLRGRMK